MPKRSGKFYRKNEAEVMQSLGLEPTPNSGSGWLIKEDGQNEDVICQLKSTDAKSIRINQADIKTLEYNAMVVHKIPVFAIQFLNDNSIYLMVKPQDLPGLDSLLKGESREKDHIDFLGFDMDAPEVTGGIKNKSKGLIKKGKVIKSSESARKAFMESNADKYKRQPKSAT